MKKIAAIYTAEALVDPLKKLHKEIMSESELINIVDDSLIQEVIKKGKVTFAVKRRLLEYYEAAIYDIKADIILNTCSSVGEVVDIASEFYNKPIIKIDEAMAVEAVKKSKNIGVLATLSTTLNPTIKLLEKQANKIKRECEFVNGLADGAYQALIEGKKDQHDRLLVETAEKISKKVDLIVLAQGSMAKMKDNLVKIIGIPVLSSPESGLQYVKSMLEKY